MYILTQDKKTLLEFGKIRIFKTGKRHVLEASERSGSFSPVYIAEFETEKEAVYELEKIKTALAEGQAVYEV